MNVTELPRFAETTPALPSLTLVTTVLNDRVGCMNFLEQMTRQTQLPSEIVIVDGGSRDGTWEFLQAAASQPQPWSLRVTQESGCNVARGRNQAIKLASHEVIASTDVGCIWEPEWLAELVAPFGEHPGCQAVMGSWSVREEDLTSVWAQVEYALQPPRLVATNRSDASSRSIAYTRALWRELGGYPEDLTLAGDDLTYVFLLHLLTPAARVEAAPVARCHWERPETFRAFRREARRNFRGASEAGVFLTHTLKVGGRMLVEALGLAMGLILLAAEIAPWVAIGLLAAAVASLAGRVWRLRTAVGRAQRLDVPQPWGRLLLFEYAIKLWGIVGFWEGWWRGAKQCQDCRRRLRWAREAGVR